MIQIPPQNKWTVSNSGKVFGSIQNARNVHFDDEGRLTLSRRATSIFTSSDASTFNRLMAIVPYSTYYVLVTGDGCFSLDATTLTVSTIAGSPSTGSPESDATNWQNRVYVTSQTNLNYYDGASWTGSLLSLTDNVPHPVCVFKNLNQLAVGNGNTVSLLDTSHSVQATLTIPSEFQVTSIRWRQNNIYVGTKHIYRGEAFMFIWNGSGTSAQSGFGVKSNWIYSLEEYQSSITGMTAAGQLLRFNGGGFDVLANLPVYYSQLIWNESITAGKVFNRGMVADGDVLYINLDGDITQQSDNVSPSTYLINQPSGVWCFDPKVGLYPKSLSVADKYSDISVSSIDTSTGIITLGSSMNAITGEPVWVKTISSITGITSVSTYFVIKKSATTLQLALTQYDAKKGNAITLGGSAGSAALRFLNYKSIGNVTFGVDAGAIALITAQSFPPTMFGSPVIWGCRTLSPTSVSTNLYSLCMLTLGQNVGVFDIQRLYSQNVKDLWQKAYLKYGGLFLDSDKIVVKYRVNERSGTPSVIFDTGTWTSTTSFSMTQTNKSLFPFQVGDEITLLAGSRAGMTTQITDIVNGSGTWVIGVADAIGTASDTFYFVADTWQKIKVIDNTLKTNSEGYAEIDLSPISPRLDLRFEITGHETYIENIVVINSKNK